MRKCPYCSERNPNEAIACSFCGRMLPGAPKPGTAAPVPPAPYWEARAPASKGWWPRLWGGIVWLLVAAGIVFEVLGLLSGSESPATGARVPTATRPTAEAVVPAATARRPTAEAAAPALWPRHEAESIKAECRSLAEGHPSWQKDEKCYYYTADYGLLLGYPGRASWGTEITVQYTAADERNPIGGVEVPRDQYQNEFLPSVRERHGPGDRVCFYTAYARPITGTVHLVIGARNVSLDMDHLETEIRLCPEGM